MSILSISQFQVPHEYHPMKSPWQNPMAKPTAELHIRSSTRLAFGTSTETDLQLHHVGAVSLRIQPTNKSSLIIRTYNRSYQSQTLGDYSFDEISDCYRCFDDSNIFQARKI